MKTKPLSLRQWYLANREESTNLKRSGTNKVRHIVQDGWLLTERKCTTRIRYKMKDRHPTWLVGPMGEIARQQLSRRPTLCYAD